MHVHQSIWKDGKPVFAGNKYADLSDTCLSYIAGVIKHAKAINAFTNPSTNSYSAWCRAMKPPCCSPTPRATACAKFPRICFLPEIVWHGWSLI
jgi:hypothetical protein